MDNPRLKILVVTTSFPLSADSYSGIFVKRIIDHLPLDIRVTVLTPDSDQVSTTPAGKNISIVKFRYAPKSLQVLANRPGGIPAALRARKLNYLLLPSFLTALLIHAWHLGKAHDLIHANWSINGFIGGIAGKLLNKPVLVSFMGSDVTLAKSSTIHRLLLEFCLRRLDHAVCVSRDMMAGIRKNYPESSGKLSVITNGVDSILLDAPRQYEDRELLTIVSVGSLVQVKGYDVTIRALAAVSGKCSFKFLCIGDGTEKPALQALVSKYSLEDAVVFTGSLAPDKVYEELIKADIFILSSRSEGMPNVLLEAMASGLPVIASNIDGVAELINHKENGYLFERENTGQLADLIVLLASGRDLRKTAGCNARLTIRQKNMTWDNTAAAYLQTYIHILNKTTK